jgi:excinuclease UvrABC helicase subunit UvrB
VAAQLYSEFKAFFPNNMVEYFVSYYDYYQPEAFIPTTGVYIEKDLQINDEIEKLRLSATSALLSGRRDVIVVASISCIYGIGNPIEFHKSVIPIKRGQAMSRQGFLHRLVEGLYSRTRADFTRGTFRVQGDNVDVYLAYADYAVRVTFFGNEIESIHTIHVDTGKKIMDFQNTQFTLAECKTEATVARVFVNHCIAQHLQGKLDAATASMAKYWTTDLEGKIVDRCLQLFGGYGFMDEYPISRMYRDSRIQRIYGGTNEIMKILIARTL